MKTLKNNRSLSFLLGLLLFSTYSYSQEKLSAAKFKGFDNPNILSIHPFGVFSSRINQNFQLKAANSIRLQFDMGSANVWSAPVQTFRPKSAEDRETISQVVWHGRDGFFGKQFESDSTFFHADAIIRTFNPSVIVPVSEKSELQFSARSFLVTEGNFPFATVLTDGFIEAFHSNIKGGEDPFARKIYGFNKAEISYVDREGRNFRFKRNDFVFAGIQSAYYHYTDAKLPLLGNVSINLGGHLGINTTKVNPSIDLGISQTTVKEVKINHKSLLLVGFGGNLLRKEVIKYGEGVELTTNDYILSLNIQPKYVRQVKKDKYFSFGWHYMYQTPYNKRKEFDDIIITGERIGWWHNGAFHLYFPIEVHTFTLSFFKKNTGNVLSFYLQQDFKLNNNPDLQTGISYQVRL